MFASAKFVFCYGKLPAQPAKPVDTMTVLRTANQVSLNTLLSATKEESIIAMGSFFCGFQSSTFHPSWKMVSGAISMHLYGS